MRIYRTYICKFGVLLLVLAGFGLHLAQPLSARQKSHAFTQWLQSIAKEDQSADIQQKLQRLKAHQGDLAPLIHKASELVHQNNDDFRLPIADVDTTPSDIFQLLLQKWSLFKTGEAMQPLAPPHHDSSDLLPNVRTPGSTLTFSAINPQVAASSAGSALLHHTHSNPSRVDVMPLTGGTAIGAP